MNDSRQDEGRILDAQLHPLDRQILDCDGKPTSTADDVELDGIEWDEPPRLNGTTLELDVKSELLDVDGPERWVRDGCPLRARRRIVNRACHGAIVSRDVQVGQLHRCVEAHARPV